MHYTVEVELDVDLSSIGGGTDEPHGSDARFADVALSWLEGGACLLEPFLIVYEDASAVAGPA